MLRSVVLLLLLANAAFFAWTQGWLAPLAEPPRPEQREPERLVAQVKPELVTVMTPKAASAALAAAAARESETPVCLQAGPFTDKTVAEAEAVLTQNGMPEGSWTREQQARGSIWAVYMGRFADRDVMRAKADELRRLSISFSEVSEPPLLAPGLKLTSFTDRQGAESSLNQLTQKGVRTARVVEMPAGATQHWLRVPRADGELQTRIKALPTAGLGGGFGPCKSP